MVLRTRSPRMDTMNGRDVSSEAGVCSTMVQGCCWVWAVLDLSGPARGFPSNLARGDEGKNQITSRPFTSTTSPESFRLERHQQNHLVSSGTGVGWSGR